MWNFRKLFELAAKVVEAVKIQLGEGTGLPFMYYNLGCAKNDLTWTIKRSNWLYMSLLEVRSSTDQFEKVSCVWWRLRGMLCSLLLQLRNEQIIGQRTKMGCKIILKIQSACFET